MSNILLVDDEQAIRASLKEALEYYGFEVTEASNGAEGLEHFNNIRALNLVITDLNMPTMDGIEFARSIRNSNRSDMPIIAMTGFSGNYNTNGDLFDSFIEKPFDLASFIKTVKRYFES